MNTLPPKRSEQSLFGFASSLSLKLLATDGKTLNRMARAMYEDEAEQLDEQSWSKLSVADKRAWINRAQSAILGLRAHLRGE